MKLSKLVESFLIVDSEASEEAKKHGLVYAGWSKWVDKNGTVVARTVDGKLQFVNGKSAIQQPTNGPKVDERVVRAKDFAEYAHGDQKYGIKPYMYHLQKVYDNVVRFGGDIVEQQAAWLHDTVEDTAVTPQDIAEEFGIEVAYVVELVTNHMGKKLTYERMKVNPRAVFVKLCDRLANVQEGQKNDMYRKEYPMFRSILYKPGQFDKIWVELDRILGENHD